MALGLLWATFSGIGLLLAAAFPTATLTVSSAATGVAVGEGLLIGGGVSAQVANNVETEKPLLDGAPLNALKAAALPMTWWNAARPVATPRPGANETPVSPAATPAPAPDTPGMLDRLDRVEQSR